jgi:U6 snRNA-associated Sm-like protein LSm8
MEYLKELHDKVVSVITLDGRCIVGTLKGSDPTCNLVLADSHERVFSEDKGMEMEPLGLYLIRGDSV